MKNENEGGMPDIRKTETAVSEDALGSQRRRMLGWLSMGVIGAVAFNVLPFKRLTGGLFTRKRPGKANKRVAINEMAVKRNRKASRNV